MLKPVIAGTALLALAGSSFVYAQQGFGGHGGYGGRGDGGPRMERRHRPSAADIAAFTDARIAALKAGLELTPDQVKNWPPFEQAVRDMVQLRVARMQARQAGDQQTPTSPFDRLSRRADNMSKTSVALKKVADAGAPLYQSLNDDQKARFVQLARILRPHHHMRGDNGQGWRHAEGYGRGGDGQGGHRFGQNGSRMQNLSGDDTDQSSKL
jgi:zinc resistance-associated protein